MLSSVTEELVDLALREDLSCEGDRTTQFLIPEDLFGEAQILAKQDLVVCGHEVAKLVFEKLDSKVSYVPSCRDGVKVVSGEILARISGPYGSILTGERICLNFLQRLSGIATRTAHFVSLLGDLEVALLDTRKTTPGWRELEKYAVKTGGGVNHRFGLFDGVLIKNNHIDAAKEKISVLLSLVSSQVDVRFPVEVEVRNMEELEEALLGGAKRVLLDNMSPEEVKACVQRIRRESSSLWVEASGGITEENIVAYASTGINALSLGTLTHSAQAVDIALHFSKRA